MGCEGRLASIATVSHIDECRKIVSAIRLASCGLGHLGICLTMAFVHKRWPLGITSVRVDRMAFGCCSCDNVDKYEECPPMGIPTQLRGELKS
eukprot:6266735-Amphidinium_carterae.2